MRIACLWALALAGLAVAMPVNLSAATSHYRLVQGSSLVDDCPVCGRPTLIYPLRGAFDLDLLATNPLSARYALTNIQFTADTPADKLYQITGSGSYQVGGEVAVVQTLYLELLVSSGVTNKRCGFTNAPGSPELPWPMLRVNTTQTNGTLLQTFSVNLVAAPLQELWFSTVSGLTPARPGFDPPHLENGDILSDSGRVVRRNGELLARFSLMPSPSPTIYDVDALDAAPGGEILFSLRQDVFSEKLGWLHHGDLLSDRGRIVKTNGELLAAFRGMPPLPDVGLDGVQVMPDGAILFSIATNAFSETLGVMLTRGDLLSNKGQIVKTSQQLLSSFQPNPKDGDYGLRAFHVWPGGEVWFSTETGFNGALGPVLAGDLLSDQGYIVFRNLELMSAFAPLEDLADFGLDALFVVTDTLPTPPPPRLLSVTRSVLPPGWVIQWDAPGRVFQLEMAPSVAGPYGPASQIMPDTKWLEADPLWDAASGFYRLRAW
jgi:hypothetical protein